MVSKIYAKALKHKWLVIFAIVAIAAFFYYQKQQKAKKKSPEKLASAKNESLEVAEESFATAGEN